MEPTEAEVRLPPVVYVPCRAVPAEDERLEVEMRETDDGRVALMAYTALDRLVDACGDRQPWVLLTVAQVAEIDEYSPYDVIMLDVDIPVSLRHR